MQGKLVLEQKLEGLTQTVGLNNLNKGIYSIKILSNNVLAQSKLVIQ